MAGKSAAKMQIFDAVGYRRHPHGAGRCSKQKRPAVDPNSFGEQSGYFVFAFVVGAYF